MNDRDHLPAHSPARRRIMGSGTSEATWGRSPLMTGFAACDITLWPARYERIWVLTPHPDDEVLALGGSLRQLSALGADLGIVAVTDGEGEHGGVAGATLESRSEARTNELRQGLDALQVNADVSRLRLPDGRIDAHRQELLQALVDRVGPGDLLLATCRFDGEPDHEACGEVAVLVAELTGAVVYEYPVWMWQWAAPGEVVVPWRRARRIPLAAETLGRKRDAIAAFRSQLEVDAEHPTPPLATYALPRYVRPFEVVFT